RESNKPRQGVVANTLNLSRNGAVGFIDLLDGCGAPKCDLPADAFSCEVQHKPNKTPLNTAEYDRNEREYVTRGVVHKREVGEENGEVDKRHDEPAQVAIRVPSRAQPPHIKCEDERRVDEKQ